MANKKKDERRTPVKASSVIQSMHAENLFPPSLQDSSQNTENLEILLQNMTPDSSSSAAVSQDMLSQQSRDSEALSQDLSSQNSYLSTRANKFILNVCILTPQVRVPQLQPKNQKESLNNLSHPTKKKRDINSWKQWHKLQAKEGENGKPK